MQLEFDNSVSKLAENLKRTLCFIPESKKQKCEEIRLRAGLPVCLTVGGRIEFVCKNSDVCISLPKNPLIATKDDINITLSQLCNRSIYLHESEIKQGFISLSNGCRAGVCGVFNTEEMLVEVRSINIRIARQILNCADYLLPFTTGGLLIAGPPGSGKTTLLRDLVRQLSNGNNGRYYRVSVIDSRSEISGGGTFDLGVNTDVLYTSQKAHGIDIALRTMYPDFIVFDEIGNTLELERIIDCFNAGVGIITTVHSGSKYDALERKIVQKMMKLKAIKNIAVLNKNIGKKAEIFTVEELIKNVDY